MQSQPSDRESQLPWVVILAAGYLIGQTKAQGAVLNFYTFVDKHLVPVYTLLVITYISDLIWQRYLAPRKKKRRITKREAPAALRADLQSALADEGVEEDQPCDLTGAYKLISLENFDSFLEVQGKNIFIIKSIIIIIWMDLVLVAVCLES
jgi:hypothetical protein